MRFRARHLAALSLLAVGGMPTILMGQEMGQEEERILEPVPHDQVISLNPVGLFFSNDWLNAEYERKMTEAITGGLGLGWSALDGGKDDYTYFTGFFRYYTTGYAFSGLFLGARGGLVKVDVVDDEGDDEGSTKLGLGLDVGFSWALGPGRAFYVAPSLGLMTLLGEVNDANSWFPILGAVNIGVAF